MKILTYEDLRREASELYVKHFPDKKPLSDVEVTKLTNYLIGRPGAKK